MTAGLGEGGPAWPLAPGCILEPEWGLTSLLDRGTEQDPPLECRGDGASGQQLGESL